MIETIQTNWPLLVSVAGGLTALSVAWKKVAWPAIIGIWHAQQEIADTVRALNRIVDAQLTVNGGGSLIDKANQAAVNHEAAMAAVASLRDEIRTEIATLHLNQVTVKEDQKEIKRQQQKDTALLKQAIMDTVREAESRIVKNLNDHRARRRENSL